MIKFVSIFLSYNQLCNLSTPKNSSYMMRKQNKGKTFHGQIGPVEIVQGSKLSQSFVKGQAQAEKLKIRPHIEKKKLAYPLHVDILLNTIIHKKKILFQSCFSITYAYTITKELSTTTIAQKLTKKCGYTCQIFGAEGPILTLFAGWERHPFIPPQ